jgi:DNA polymerase III subunit delta'
MTANLPYPWQLDIWEQLLTQSQANRLPHALLIQGEPVTGKRHFVNALAQKMLCAGVGEFACGECKNCQLFLAGTHADFVNIGLEEKSKQIKVDQIRAVIEFISKTSQQGGMKIVVIEPAEQMNINAANSLLKCLEEPAGDSLIILLSHAPNRLLPTIRSRCQNIVIDKPQATQADKWLATFIQNEEQRKTLMMLANNNPLLALEYADKEMIDIYKNTISQLAALQAGSDSLVKQAEKIDKEDEILQWLFIQQKILWLLIKQGFNVGDVSRAGLQSLLHLVQKPHFQKRGYKLLEEIQQAINEVQGVTNPNTLMLVESLLIRWQALLRA